jgi:hypothetical protein
VAQAEVHAQLAAKHAQVANRYSAAATKPRDLAKTVRDQAVQFASDARTQATSAANLEANNLLVEAKRAEQQAAVERNRAEAAFRRSESLEKDAQKFEKLATDFKDLANRSQASVDDTQAAVDLAESHYRRSYGLLKDAALALKQTRDSADHADRESARASAYADVEATCGDEARARVARDRSNVAARHAQLTSDQLGLADQNFEHVEAVVSDARTAVNDAQAELVSVQSFRDLAQSELDQLVTSRAGIAQAENKAKEAYNREAALRNGQDFAGARLALGDVLAAKAVAENRSEDVKAHAKQAQQYAAWATDRESDARADARRAEAAAERAHAFTAIVKEAATRAAQLAANAAC